MAPSSSLNFHLYQGPDRVVSNFGARAGDRHFERLLGFAAEAEPIERGRRNLLPRASPAAGEALELHCLSLFAPLAGF